MASLVMTEKGELSSDIEGLSSSSSTTSGAEFQNFRSCSVSEIEEEISSEEELFEINGGVRPLASIKEEIAEGSLFSNDINHHESDDKDDNIVYVAVGKNENLSMDALVWTLNHAVHPPSSALVVYLIHVFPEVRHIPTPLGKLPISQVNPEQKESYLIQERSKRRDFLQKFIHVCSASKVKVETILIESDMEAKAILDLIPILNIRKLVLGTSKSNLRKLKSRKGNETADQMLQNVPEFCELNIICEGKQVVFEEGRIDQSTPTPTPTPSPRGHTTNIIVDNTSPKLSTQEQNQINDSFTCSCFKPKVVA